MSMLAVEKRNEAVEEIASLIHMVLPKDIDLSRFASVALTVVKSQALIECTTDSKKQAVYECAQLGLWPDPALGHIYLIPFRVNAAKKGEPARYENQVKVIPGYQGYIELARRSGRITTVHTEIVYERDSFSTWTDGTGKHLKHDADAFASEGHRGKKVGVYCVATMRDGGAQIETMSAADVAKIQSRAKASEFGPWQTDEDMMWRKSVVRRARKYWPQSPELARFGVMDDGPPSNGFAAPEPPRTPTVTSVLERVTFRPAEEAPPTKPLTNQEKPTETEPGLLLTGQVAPLSSEDRKYLEDLEADLQMVDDFLSIQDKREVASQAHGHLIMHIANIVEARLSELGAG